MQFCIIKPFTSFLVIILQVVSQGYIFYNILWWGEGGIKMAAGKKNRTEGVGKKIEKEGKRGKGKRRKTASERLKCGLKTHL